MYIVILYMWIRAKIPGQSHEPSWKEALAVALRISLKVCSKPPRQREDPRPCPPTPRNAMKSIDIELKDLVSVCERLLFWVQYVYASANLARGLECSRERVLVVAFIASPCGGRAL